MAANATTETEANRQTVLKFLEVFSSGDVTATLDLMDDSGTWWVNGTTDLSGEKSKEDFRAMLSSVAANCKGPITLTPRGSVAEGDKVAVEVESYAELNNGRIYNNEYHFLITARDGKVFSVREYCDTEHVNDIFFR